MDKTLSLMMLKTSSFVNRSTGVPKCVGALVCIIDVEHVLSHAAMIATFRAGPPLSSVLSMT